MKYYEIIVQYIEEIPTTRGNTKEKRITQKYLVKQHSCKQAIEQFKIFYCKMVNNFTIKSSKQTKYTGVISKKQNNECTNEQKNQ